jgi:hypothetical protein
MQGTHVAFWIVSAPRTLFSQVNCLTKLARQHPITGPELWEGNVSRRGPARSSLERKARILHIELDPSTYVPASHKWLVHHCSLLQLFFLVAAEASTELECEGKEGLRCRPRSLQWVASCGYLSDSSSGNIGSPGRSKGRRWHPDDRRVHLGHSSNAAILA